MKYLLYRAPCYLYNDIRKHELIAVEFGRNIDDVAGTLIKDVQEDLSCTPAFAGCDVHAFEPEPTVCFPLSKKYPYEMIGYVVGMQRNGQKGVSKGLRVEYGIMEKQE